MKITSSSEVVYDYNSLEIHVNGNADRNERVAIIIVSTNRGQESTIISGPAFNEFWEGFLHDKDAIRTLFEKKGIDVDISDLPDDVLNQEVV